MNLLLQAPDQSSPPPPPHGRVEPLASTAFHKLAAPREGGGSDTDLLPWLPLRPGSVPTADGAGKALLVENVGYDLRAA